MKPAIAQAIQGLLYALPETDPVERWLPDYETAWAHYNYLKWFAYPVSLALSLAVLLGIFFVALHFIRAWALPFGFRISIGVAGCYEAFALRALGAAAPWPPWPAWMRTFTRLHDTLGAFRRVLKRRDGEDDA